MWGVKICFGIIHSSGIFFPLFSSDPEQLKKELNELVSAIEECFFQPQKYNLQPKAEWNIPALGVIPVTHNWAELDLLSNVFEGQMIEAITTSIYMFFNRPTFLIVLCLIFKVNKEKMAKT